MKNLPGLACRQVCVLLFLLCVSLSQGQISHFGQPPKSPFSQAGRFSDLTSAVAASDPADAVCARSAVGAVVSDPVALSSQNGVLEVTFHFQSAVDANGLTRYCYVYTDSAGNQQESPTLEVKPGDRLNIHFYNDLTATSASSASAHAMHAMNMRPAASAADSACSATSVTSTTTNLHFHGTNVAPVCHQDEVVSTLIQPQTNFDYTVLIPSNEPPGAYWYHPHPHGFSDAQVIGGATGVILVQGIENVNPVVAGLPERVFVLRDQDLPASEATDSGIPKTDLSINYVPILYPSYAPAVIQTGPSEKEFWRVLNTSGDTLLDLEVLDNGVPQPLQIVSVDGVPLTDSNGNATTVTQTNYVLSPASRVEFIVTTPASGDTTAQLVSQTWDNGPSGDYDPGRPIASIVAVSPTSTAAATAAIRSPKRLPSQTATRHLTRFSALDASSAVTQRTLYFSVAPDFSAFFITLDGQTPAPFSMDGPPNITVTEGTVEQWTVENRSTMDHNFHIHQLHFQTLAVDGTPVTDTTRRDTIDIPHWSGNTSDPYPSVTLLMDFRDPNIVGTFVYHCHILSHEDRGMMGKIQVLPGVTSTTVSASPANAPAGTSVTLTATVAAAAGNGTPTGTVSFQNGSTTLGTATLNNSGVATLNTTALPIGSNAITADYSGDASFATSTATAVTVAVTAATTSTVLTSSASTVTIGASVTFSATVTDTSGTGVAAGTVTFLNGSSALGTATLNSSGVGTYTTSSLPAGSASITASYAGNSSFAASTSSAMTVVVNLAPTTTALTASPTTVVSGNSVTFTAVVTGTAQAGTPSGSVTFNNGSTALGTSSLNSAGTATYSTSSLAVGTASITATYAGNSSFATSTSSPASVVVSAPPPPDFGVAASPASVSLAQGASGTTTITITPENGFNSAVGLSCSGLPSGASWSYSPASVTPDGAHAITATMTIVTTGNSAFAHPLFLGGSRPLYALVLPGVGALLGLGSVRRRMPPAARRISMISISLLLAAGFAACGGGSMMSGSSGTPIGTSLATITATSGTTTHTTTLTLNVTK